MQRRRSLATTADAFAWTEQKRQAAALIAESGLPFAEIARQVGVARETLYSWRQNGEFAAYVAGIEAELDKDVRTLAITRRRDRLAGYDERRAKTLRVIESRAAWFAANAPDVPGGETGLLVKTLKVVGSGPTAHTVPEYVVDTALLKEIRALEQAAAIELGQWQEKADVGVSVQQVAVTERTIMRLPPREIPADIRDSIEQVLSADAGEDIEEGDFRSVAPRT